MLHRFLTLAVCLASLFVVKDSLLAAGGTSVVASKGQPTYVSPTWPAGVGELINDPVRTTGWNSWFTEWPNDVNQYAFEIASMDDLNRLIIRLAAIKTDLRQIRLSYLKEPSGLGWVTRLPQGNGIPVIFSIGDQARIDDWYKNVRKPFGVMEFTAAPVAVPPTLTIFVQNDLVNLNELVIPPDISVSPGYVPTVFHKSNTMRERQRGQERSGTQEKDKPDDRAQKLDDSSAHALKEIELFLEPRKASNPR